MAMVRRFTLFLLFILAVISQAAVAQEADTQAAVTTEYTAQFKQYADTFSQIEEKLDEDRFLSDVRLSQYRDNARQILEQLRVDTEEIATKLDSQKELVDSFGPPPAEGQPAEDAELTKERQDAAALYAAYVTAQQRNKTLIERSQDLLSKIADTRLQMKAKGLVQRSVPLYNFTVIKNAVSEVPVTVMDLLTAIAAVVAGFTSALLAGSGVELLLITVALMVVVCLPLRSYIVKAWGIKPKQLHVTMLTKAEALVTYILASGVLPAAALYLVVYSITQMDFLTVVQSQALQSFAVAIGGLLIAYSFWHALLPAAAADWRIFPLYDSVVTKLRRHLYVLSLLVSIVWLFNAWVSVVAMSPDFVQMVRFVLRTIVCVFLFPMLRGSYWLPVGEAERIELKAWVRFVMWAAALIVLTNPLLIFIGFVTLANVLFANFLLTTVLFIAMYIVLGVAQQGVSLTLDKSGRLYQVLQSKLDLSERSQTLLQHWLGVLVGLAVWVAGAVALLLIWGFGHERLLDWSEMLIYGFPIGQHHFSLLAILLAIVLFFGLLALTRFIQNNLERRVFPYTTLDTGAQHALKTAVGYVGLAVAFIVSINTIGFELSSILFILGGLSVGIGLGLQPIVTNFVSGLIMLVERPVKIGDTVDVAGFSGTIKRISVRATEVQTFQRASVLIPNSQLITEPVTNWTLSSRQRRVEIIIGVAYGSDVKQVRDILYELAAKEQLVLKDPPPFVVFKDFGASSLDFELRVFVDDGGNCMIVSNNLRYAINERFAEEGIEIPFPQQDVHIHKSE